MFQDQSFGLVMTRLRQGDQAAATEVVQRFVKRLVALASSQFEDKLKFRADPEDVVQSVYATFFRRNDCNQFTLANWESVWALLSKITVFKCGHRKEYWYAECRNPAREAISGLNPAQDYWHEDIDREPTPEEAMVLAETIAELIRTLEPMHRKIAELYLQGYSSLEIAERCDCSERNAGRIVKRFRERIDDLLKREMRS